jgi:predicted site-specific integrase-resolvase
MNADAAMNEIEAAERLGLSVATLRAWRHRGKGPRFVRLGRAVRYLPDRSCRIHPGLRS